MEKVKVFYSKDVVVYMNKLVDTLFEKEYFNYIKNADDYVDNIRHDIENYIHLKQHKKILARLKRHGIYHCSIRTSFEHRISNK